MNRSEGEQERLYSQAAEEFGGALERLARAYERDADDRRRDLLQEIHVALWRSLASFDDPGDGERRSDRQQCFSTSRTFVGTAWWHRRHARLLQREIDELG